MAVYPTMIVCSLVHSCVIICTDFEGNDFVIDRYSSLLSVMINME